MKESSSADEYFAAQPGTARTVLERVRTVIRNAVPKAEEVISYKMPTYKLNGRTVLHLAGWKRHYSLYPCGAELVAAFQRELTQYEVNNKGTIRFPLSKPVPVQLIARIAKFRAEEIVERANKKGRWPPPRKPSPLIPPT